MLALKYRQNFSFDSPSWQAVDTNLNLIVTEECPASPSVSQHLEFIYWWDKHKYSHIILHKPPNTSYTPCCERLGGLSPACSDRIREIEMTFLPADCKDRYVTTQHLLKVGKRGEERRLRSDSQPLCSHLLSMLTFQSVLYHVRMWFENVPLTLWFWGWAVENRFECVSCFLGCFQDFQTKHE